MTDLETLHQLQGIDREIDERTRRLAQVTASLGESEELKRARQELEDARKRLHDLETRQRELEWDVDDRTSKIRQLETKLYSGTVKNPKELSGLQTEIEHLKITLSDHEGVALQTMADCDEQRALTARLERALAEVEAAWKAQQEEAKSEKAAVEAALAALKAKRAAPADAVPRSLLAQYEQIRKTRAGLAVARIERNTCQGCRTTLATAQVQSARLGKITNCSACGRILYQPR